MASKFDQLDLFGAHPAMTLEREVAQALAQPSKPSGKSAFELGREVAALMSPDPARVAAYEDKLERKRDRLEAASAKHRVTAQGAYASAKARGDRIPFGQPILVGHHSERRHRSDLGKIDAGMRKSFAESDRADELAAAARVGTGGISSDDPAAVVKLKAELAGLERDQKRMKDANAMIKKHAKAGPAAQIIGLASLGYSEAPAKKLLEKEFAGRIGFPAYALTNNGANIRRIEKRIEELAKAAATPARVTSRGTTTEGMAVEIEENKDANRTQITFAGKPSEQIRSALKSAGFRWAPSEGVWQRQLSNQAWHRAHVALGLPVPR